MAFVEGVSGPGEPNGAAPVLAQKFCNVVDAAGAACAAAVFVPIASILFGIDSRPSALLTPRLHARDDDAPRIRAGSFFPGRSSPGMSVLFRNESSPVAKWPRRRRRPLVERFGSFTFSWGAFWYGIRLNKWEMQFRRARFLSSERTMCQGEASVSVASSILSRARE